jgi:serine/threonine protein kinase
VQVLQVPGTFGDFTLKRTLGKGGMAEVYLAQSHGVSGFQREIALKVIHPHLSNDQEFVQMLIDEANLSAQLNHANIVHIHHLGNEDGLYYIAMEFIDGCDVYQALVSYEQLEKTFPYEVAAWIAHEACAGLYYAHTRTHQNGLPLNIIHRDISPQNIQLSKEGDVKIVDFGIAKADQRQNHTQQGIIKGKYSYMSPEQAWGDQIDHRSDIFSLGICLYEMIAGEVLYDAEDGLGLLEQVRLAQIPNLRALHPNLPIDLERIVYRSLNAEPQDRYRDAEEMRKELASYLYKTGVNSGRQMIVSFMQSLNGTPMVNHGKQTKDDQTQAVNAQSMQDMMAMSSHNDDSKFMDQDKTKALSADLFSQYSSSSPAAAPPMISSKSHLLSSQPIPIFEQEAKTRAIAADQFSSLQSAEQISPQEPDQFLSESQEKTRAVSAEIFAKLKTPAFSPAPSSVSVHQNPSISHAPAFQGLSGSKRPLPPPPPSLLASTTATSMTDFQQDEKTKAFSITGFDGLHLSPAQAVASPALAPPSPPRYLPSITSATTDRAYLTPNPEPSRQDFPSPFSSNLSVEKETVEAVHSTEPISSPPSIPEVSLADSSNYIEPVQSERVSKAKEKKREKKKKRSVTPKTKARSKSSSNLVMVIGGVIILSAVILGLGTKLLKPAAPSQYVLSVSANAQGAKVYRDGQDTGQYTPALLQGLKPGVEYMIKISATGYESMEQSVSFDVDRISKQREQSLRLFLKRATGTLRVKSTPSDASVYMNNEYLGKTPLYKRSIERAEGGVEIKFRREGCDPKTVILTWGDDLDSLIDTSLRCP